MKQPDCSLCNFSNPEQYTLIAQNDLAFACWDNSPASQGHVGIAPKHHVECFFDLETAQWVAMYGLATAAQEIIRGGSRPDAYTIGVDDGLLAGQIVPHVYLQMIPRYIGDVPDPKGGVRHIIPSRADYWS